MPLTVGLLGLLDLADALRSAGYDVVGGTANYRADAAELRKDLASLESAGQVLYPIIASAVPELPLKHWFNKWSKSTTMVIIRNWDNGDDPPLVVSQATWFDTPVSFNEVLQEIGLDPLDGDVGDRLILGPAGQAPEPMTPRPRGRRERTAPEDTELFADNQNNGQSDGHDDSPDDDDDLWTSDDSRPVAIAPAPAALGDSNPGADNTDDDDDDDGFYDESEIDDLDTNDVPSGRHSDDSGPRRVVRPPRSESRPSVNERIASRSGRTSPPPVTRPKHRQAPDTGFDTEDADGSDDDDFYDEPPAPPERTRNQRPTDRPPTRPRTPPPPVADDDDDGYDDEYDDPADLEVFRPAETSETTPGAPRRKPARKGRRTDTPVVFSLAFKGGVGKTTTALSLGQRAAEQGNLRVIVVDANRGQSDITTYLRLGRATIPTIWDAARTGEPRNGFAQPSQINAARHPKLDQIPFGLVLGPPASKADPKIVTAELYTEMIETAREVSDLVVVDTQIIEAHDTSGLIDGLVIPMLRAGAWAVSLSDLSSASVKNAHAGAKRFRDAGVPLDRLLLMLNRVEGGANVDMAELSNSFRDRATLVGAVTADGQTIQAMNQGRIVTENADMLKVFDDILYRVTADDAFDPAQHQSFIERSGVGGVLKRFLGRKK